MNISRRRILGTLSALAATPCVASGLAAAASARSSEVGAIRAFAERTHPRGLAARDDSGWRSSWLALEASADALGDGAYLVALRRALSWFKDGHTTVLPFEFTGGVPKQLATGPFRFRLPLKVQVFYDAAAVVSARGPAMPLLGGRLERVGGLDIADLIRRAADRWPGNRVWGHRWGGLPFSWPELLLALGAIDDPSRPVSLTAKMPGGHIVTIDCPVVNGSLGQLSNSVRPRTAVESWLQDAPGLNFVKKIAQTDMLLVGLEEMSDQKGKTFAAFTDEALAAMSDSGLQRLAIDLRRNGGGNNFLFETLRKAVLASRFNRHGGLYVLTSPRTFSAAQNLVNRLERDSLALVAGDPTGGEPNHFGDAAVFTGPSTGLTVIVSTMLWADSYPMDRRDTIMPDILAPETYKDWWEGRDACLDGVLAHRVSQTSRQALPARDEYFGRPSQNTSWSPFWVS